MPDAAGFLIRRIPSKALFEQDRALLLPVLQKCFRPSRAFCGALDPWATSYLAGGLLDLDAASQSAVLQSCPHLHEALLVWLQPAIRASFAVHPDNTTLAELQQQCIDLDDMLSGRAPSMLCARAAGSISSVVLFSLQRDGVSIHWVPDQTTIDAWQQSVVDVVRQLPPEGQEEFCHAFMANPCWLGDVSAEVLGALAFVCVRLPAALAALVQVCSPP